jgi:hypothetical protein
VVDFLLYTLSKRRHKVHPVLFVGRTGVMLVPNQEIVMATTVTVGHKLELSIVYLDQNGNPMLTTPVPDAVPVWSNTNSATEMLVAAADGNTAEATTVAVGSDVISLSLVVGGKSFSATLAVTVQPAPQVLTSVAINATVN